MKAATITERTLLIYSGPTSTDRTIEKNGMYMDNMDYFLEHGVSCNDNNSNDASIMLDNNNDNEHATTQERVDVAYVFVLTQQVADYYLGTDGKITKKRNECKNNQGNDFETNSSNNDDEYIKVIVRQDRCYDMESMRIVLENHEMDVRNRYDHLLFVNCGLVGPKCEYSFSYLLFLLFWRAKLERMQLTINLNTIQSDLDLPNSYPPNIIHPIITTTL